VPKGAEVGWLGGEDRVDLRTSKPLTTPGRFGILSGSPNWALFWVLSWPRVRGRLVWGAVGESKSAGDKLFDKW